MNGVGLNGVNKSKWRLSTRYRILGAIIILFACFAVAGVFFCCFFAEDVYTIRKQGLESVVSLARVSLEPVLKDRREGSISIAEARLRAADYVNGLFYQDKGQANYLFLVTYEGYILAEHSSTDSVGIYQLQRRDSKGTPLMRLLLDKALAGGGFLQYYEEVPTAAKPEKIICYAVGIPEIECYLGTAMSLDDIDYYIKQFQQRLLLLGLAILAAVLALYYYFCYPLTGCINWLADIFKELADNHKTAAVVGLPASLNNKDMRRLMVNLKEMLVKFDVEYKDLECRTEKLSQLFYASGVIWEWDGKSNTTVWSGNIAGITGYEPEGFGAHFEVFEDWVHPSDRITRRNALASYFSGCGEFYLCKYLLYNSAQGCYHWVQARGIASFDDGGTPLSMVGLLIDMTDFISTYGGLNKDRDRDHELLGLQRVGDIAQQTPCVTGEMLVSQVKKRLDNELWQGIVVVEEHKPIGLIMRNSLSHQLSSQYGVSLYYQRQIKQVMNRQPLVVDSEMPLEQVAEATRNRREAELYDLIIVTSGGKYYGTVSVMDLLSRITDLRIQLAANANPLTGLPGNIVIEEKLKQVLKEPFAALYIDLDNFKAFNDKYGFEMGDRAIKLTATILKESVASIGHDEAFLGHIGGDDFIILLPDYKQAVSIAEIIIAKFDERIRSLYPVEDLAKGHITVLDRKGIKQDYPIMGVSIAVVDNTKRRFENYLEIGEVAAQLKKKAKLQEGSLWVSEQRAILYEGGDAAI